MHTALISPLSGIVPSLTVGYSWPCCCYIIRINWFHLSNVFFISVWRRELSPSFQMEILKCRNSAQVFHIKHWQCFISCSSFSPELTSHPETPLLLQSLRTNLLTLRHWHNTCMTSTNPALVIGNNFCQSAEMISKKLIPIMKSHWLSSD